MIGINFEKLEYPKFNSIQEILDSYLFKENDEITRNNLVNDISKYFLSLLQNEIGNNSNISLEVSCDNSKQDTVSILPKNMFTACLLFNKYVPDFMIRDEYMYTYPDGTYIKYENDFYIYYKP